METEQLEATWSSYKESGDIRLRNDLVMHYRPLLNRVASRVGSTLPAFVDREDLASYGVFGLMDAISKFDLDKGVQFSTYASSRIRGAILDHLRSLDWVPRSVRSKVRELEEARHDLEADLGREPSNQELAVQLDISLEDLWLLQSEASVPRVGPLVVEDPEGNPESWTTHFDPTANPEQTMSGVEITELVSKAVSGMSERSKTIVALYYIEEMTLANIGKLLGVTESRVCQLQSKVLSGLYESLVLQETVSV